MNRIAEELDEKLRSLDPERAKSLELLVREAIQIVENSPTPLDDKGWPVDYFAQTAGTLAGEDFERAPQGELPQRESW